MARHDKQLNVRMAHETIDELKKVAIENRRSLTAQLNIIVEEWLKYRIKGVKNELDSTVKSNSCI